VCFSSAGRLRQACLDVGASSFETTRTSVVISCVLCRPTSSTATSRHPHPPSKHAISSCVHAYRSTSVSPLVVACLHYHSHNRFTAPFPEENCWTLWCKGRLTEADTPTIRLGATPAGLTSAHLHHPPYFLQVGCRSCGPTNSVKALKAKALKACLHCAPRIIEAFPVTNQTFASSGSGARGSQNYMKIIYLMHSGRK